MRENEHSGPQKNKSLCSLCQSLVTLWWNIFFPVLALGGLLSLHFTNIYFVADLALGSQTIEVSKEEKLLSGTPESRKRDKYAVEFLQSRVKVLRRRPLYM